KAEESPYYVMTRELIAQFPHRAGRFRIEPDASSGSYFWAADWLLRKSSQSSRKTKRRPVLTQDMSFGISHWPTSNSQIDKEFPHYLPLPAALSREQDLGDSIMTAMIVAAARDPEEDDRAWTEFTDLGRLRLQECDRVAAMRKELIKCGARVIERGNTLRIAP